MVDCSRRLARLNSALGWISLLVMAAVVGCGSETKPITAESTKFRPADDASPAAAAQPGALNTRVGEVDPLTHSTSPPASTATQKSDVIVNPYAKGNEAAAAAIAAAPSAPAANGASAGQPAKVAKSAGNTAANTLAAPSGDLASLLAEMDRLTQQQPKGATQQEQLQDFVRTQQQRLAIGKKVLALNPDAATKQRVGRAMFEVYAIFDRLGVPGGRQQMLDFAKSLADDPDSATARLGRQMLFDINVSRIASQPLQDGKEITAEVQKLLDSDKQDLSEETLGLAKQASDILNQSGLTDDAANVLELIAKAAAENPKLADQADQYAGEAKLLRADLTALVSGVLTGEQGADTKLLDQMRILLKEVKPSRTLFANLQRMAQFLEMTPNIETAKKCYAELGAAFKDSPDEKLAAAAAAAVEGANKRLGLVGQPLAVEGLMPDGKPFDWSPYQGKIVLLDFWATWCGPCLEELPNILRNFDQFHAKGFEVVGVNLNTKVSDVRQFLTLQELPWATVTSQAVVDGKAGEDWSQLPMAARCGVDAIPFLVLIGKDGNVDSIHVRGPKLEKRLTQLLGEPIKTEIPADPTQPARPATPTGKTGALPAPPAGASIKPAASPVAFLLTQAVLAAAPDEAASDKADPDVNPYLAKPGLSPTELARYLGKMLDKPQSIQSRAGFADALVDACDRILKASPTATESEQLLAIETKFAALHREASAGNGAADERLAAFAVETKDDPRQRVARESAFFRLERRVLDAADLPLDRVPALVSEVEDYLANEKPVERHLRLASATVAAINRLEDGDAREAHFAKLGGLLAKSDDKELARYGKKLAKKSAAEDSDLVGQPMELKGTTAGGLPLDWKPFQGKVVLVDFWATWCGPCLREMPHVKEFYDQQHDRGLEVIGVSVDEDREALAKFLDENKLPWTTLAGDETTALAKKYQVRAIPTMLLVDRSGKIAAVAHNIKDLAPLAEKLLAKGAE